VHIVSTGVIGVGIADKKYLTLTFIIGVIIHFGYNIMMLQGVL
jgi:hypothetical protein